MPFHPSTHLVTHVNFAQFQPLHTDGTPGDDTINGTMWNDTINGGDGNDQIDGGDGNDQLFGDAGNDVITGGAGNDVIFGGDGNDVINGGTGNDWIDGGTGRDILTGGPGADRFAFAIGDSPVGTATSDHITDFSSPYEFGGQGDLIVTTDYVLSHRMGVLDGSYGSIEAAAAVASQFHPPGGPPLGSFLMVDRATGDAYLLMDQDGNGTLETGVVIDHGATMRIADLGYVVDAVDRNDGPTPLPIIFAFDETLPNAPHPLQALAEMAAAAWHHP